MKKGLRFWLMTFGLILMAQVGGLYAQAPQTIEVGPHGGISTYIGDINPWKPFSQFDYQVGGLVRFNYDPRWSFRLDYTYEKIKASDSVANWRPERNLRFQSKVHDVSAIVEFNFFEYQTGRIGSSISPYIFAGVSVFAYKTQPYTGIEALDTLCYQMIPSHFVNADYSLDVDRFNLVEKYYGISASIPFGVGCKLSISKHLAATIEWRMHYTFTDYLDNVHGVYDVNSIVIPLSETEMPSSSDLPSVDPNNPNREYLQYNLTDPSGLFHPGQQRGNSHTNDWFGTLNLSLTWKFVLPGQNTCKIVN